MSYKTILVQLDGAAAPVRYDIAMSLAARTGGCVTGLYLKTTVINQYNDLSTIGYLPPDDLNRLIREVDQGQNEEAARSAAVMARSAEVLHAACDWRLINGDTPDPLIAEARCADLVILPPPAAAPAYNVHASAVDVALGCGGPVLVVPPATQEARIGSRVLLAWNGGREAARALRDVLPLLTDHAAIEIRSAHVGHAGALGLEALKRRLGRHGLTVNAKVDAIHNGGVADWLKAEAAAAGCDMMVMGLYGHPRLREFVLGGVSHDMLHAPTLPLLISH